MGGAAPDGGWGWVIVFCSTTIHMLTVGGFLSLSVMFVNWLQEFNAGRGATSWIISVSLAVTYSIGPIAAHLTTKYGYRAVVVAGGLLSGAGYILAYFATNVYFLVFAIGLLSGTGSGFCFLPATVTVAMYFEKKRSLAIGLGSAGVGIGPFICAPVVHWLIQQYGWRGALLVGGAIQLNLCVIGLLLRPLSSDITERCEQISNVKHLHDECKVQDALLEEKDDNSSAFGEEKRYTNRRELGIIDKFKNQMMGGSVRHLSGASSENKPPVFSSVSEMRHNGSLGSKLSVNLDILMCGSVNSLLLIEKNILQYTSSRNSLQKNKNNGYSCTSVRTSSKHELPPSDNRSMSDLFLELKNAPPHSVQISKPLENARVLLEQPPISKSHRHLLVKNWQLLKNPVFLAFLISNILTNLSFLMPVLFMVDRAVDHGIPSASAALLVSINGAGNVFGRVFFGFISDHWVSDHLVLYIFSLAACGVATSLSSLCGSLLWLHGLYAFAFGCFIGAYTTLASVVTVDLIGVEVVGHAYGLMLLFTGVGGLVGPPLAGWFFDLTGNYSTSYLVHGLFILVSALMLIPVAAWRRR